VNTNSVDLFFENTLYPIVYQELNRNLSTVVREKLETNFSYWDPPWILLDQLRNPNPDREKFGKTQTVGEREIRRFIFHYTKLN
jgi:hypothetical protein